MKQIGDSTIIVCGIIRDAGETLERNIPVIMEICQSFMDYKIVIYENDSKDSTKEVLNKWQKNDPNHVYTLLNDSVANTVNPKGKSTKGVNPFFSRARIERMATLRNFYMNYVWEKNWAADYMMIVDLDVAQIYKEGVLDSFKSEINWDAVTAFGYSYSPRLKRRYHDSYALTMWKDQKKIQTEKTIRILSEKLGKLKPTDEWIRVFSAFGGLAIYKFDAIKNLRYLTMANDDDRVEVRCEHYSIYVQMMERGYDKFYINPSMILKYQRISWKLIARTLARYLGYEGV